MFATLAVPEGYDLRVRENRRGSMKKASEYRQLAQDCRELAAKMELGEQREQLMRMAAHWEQLARDRLTMIKLHPEIAEEEAQAEARLQAETPAQASSAS